MKLGTRVAIVGGDHPWKGYGGEVIEANANGWIVVRLDNGQEVFAWPRQWKVV